MLVWVQNANRQAQFMPYNPYGLNQVGIVRDQLSKADLHCTANQMGFAVI